MNRTSTLIAMIAFALFGSESLAVTPIPRAYYDFEEIIDGEYFRNVANPGTFDGYLGVASFNNNRHPDLVSGLRGSAGALKFDSTDIAHVPGLITDTNGDYADEDVFRGAFSVFARIDPRNAAQMHILNADRGPLDTAVRGWYMDFSNSTTNASGEYLLNPRFSVRAGALTLHATGTETTNYQNVESYGITWLPATTPGSSSDGLMQIYINGVLFAQRVHNWDSIAVGIAGFNIGGDNLVSYGGGIVIDDIAIWDRFLTSADMLEVHTQGVTLPEPGTWMLAALGALGLGLVYRFRSRMGGCPHDVRRCTGHATRRHNP